jgi:hypothetical protein
VRGGGGVRLVGKMGERRGEGDLKAGLDGPKTEYVRTHKVRSTVPMQLSGVCVRYAFELT